MGDYTTDQTKKGWLTAILELGAWLGTLLSGFLAETLSRKYGILVAATVFILGVIIQATAQSAGHNAILAGRFITYEDSHSWSERKVANTGTVVWESEAWP